MATQPYNVSIIGYGMSAKVFHIPFIQIVPDFRLYAIVQRTPNPKDDAEKDHPEVKCYRSTEEMVQDPKVDVVIVTTPPATHFELAKVALENGKHGTVTIKAQPMLDLGTDKRRFSVVVEKPFTPTSQEADELITIAKSNDRLLTVYHSRINGLPTATNSLLINHVYQTAAGIPTF